MNLPHLYLMPRWGRLCWNFVRHCVILCLAVLVQYQVVTDGQTERLTTPYTALAYHCAVTKTLLSLLTSILHHLCHQWQQVHVMGDSRHPWWCYQRILALVGHYQPTIQPRTRHQTLISTIHYNRLVVLIREQHSMRQTFRHLICQYLSRLQLVKSGSNFF